MSRGPQMSEEHRALAASVRTAIARATDDEDLWARLVEMGCAELEIEDAVVVLEELGYALRTTPLLSTLLGVEADPDVPVATLDPTLDPALLAADQQDLTGALGVVALQVGTARRALEMTVEHAKQREQFGRPIGSFQALKHRMADMLVLVEMSRSALAAAVADRALVPVAKAYCSDALDRIAAETVQLHGGIAMTWEHDAHLVLKRAHSLGQLFGTAREHRQRVEW